MSKEKIHPPQYYQDYLGLEKILKSQHLISEEYGNRYRCKKNDPLYLNQAYSLSDETGRFEIQRQVLENP